MQELEKNIDLFTRYKAISSVLPWLPVFFLFFIERVSLGEAVLLGSASYFSVVLLEVPSGYCSDRYGRRPTLIVASLLAVFACALFLVANTLFTLLVAQILLASRIAFQSGSDSALLYDSLRVLGRESEYTEHESKAQKWSMIALACSCLVGGGLGMIDLRLPYLLGLLAAILGLVLSLRFVEPPAQGDQRAASFFVQMQQTLAYFSHPLLRWLLLFFVLGYSLEHVPYEFYQPYVKLLDQGKLTELLGGSSAPLISAIVMSISMFGGAIGAAASQTLLSKLGLRFLLLASVLVQLIIIGGMSLLLHPAILLLVMFRNFAMSMAHGPLLGAVAPHVSSEQRATFLSALSLSGRAAFSTCLIILSVLIIGQGDLDWITLTQVLYAAVLVGGVALLLLFLWSKRISDAF